MSRTVIDYLNLITSAYRDQPNYTAIITANVSILVQVQTLLSAMQLTLFDVDLAVGDQLDIIGQWVGITREVKIPILGVYFSWDGTDAVGWDYGTWAPSLSPSGVVVLPDEFYRTLIKAKIAANQWDGTTEGAYTIWETLFPDLVILIQDNQNMSYDLAFFGQAVDSLTIALITAGYIPLKPEGVRINEYFFPANTGPLFGWDLDSDFIKGWETGSWAMEMFPT